MREEYAISRYLDVQMLDAEAKKTEHTFHIPQKGKKYATRKDTAHHISKLRMRRAPDTLCGI